MAIQLPTVVNLNGLLPQTPASINDQIIVGAIALSPGLTTNLPGILIEDMTSTDTAAVVLMDSARVETVDSITPYGANAWLLTELGNIYGTKLGTATNTGVQVIFSGNPGYTIPVGFLVSDGIYQYIVQDGGAIGSGGQSAPLKCLAVLPGIWAIPSGTVTEIATSVPSIYTITCSNPFPGTPGTGAQTESDYRAQVVQAGLSAGLGFPSAVKTALLNVVGVQARLISVQQQIGGGWKILVGGGDPYAVAFAILNSCLDVSLLIGSSLVVDSITTAIDAVVTTVLNHGYANGQICYVHGVRGMTGINGVPLTVTVIDEKNFSTGVSSALYGAYTGGGTLTPNFRNNEVSLINFPDVYTIAFISPPQQIVAISVTWNTSATNFINQSAVHQLGAPALAAYINSIYAGQPINLYDLQTTFQVAIASVLSPALLTRMVFAVSINGVGVSPLSGTGIINGDPESYVFTQPDGSEIIITQG